MITHYHIYNELYNAKSINGSDFDRLIMYNFCELINNNKS